MAQIVYYFYAALALGAPARQVCFSVPTGNFGDIFAGYIAYKMGLPIKKLIIATNKNDILHRFLSNNDYSTSKVHHSLAPSMDIQVASNFERLLFDLYDNDPKELSDLMEQFAEGKISIAPAKLENARKIFGSHAVDDAHIKKTIKQVFDVTGYLLDPHTAIGYEAACKESMHDLNVPIVTLATAHPSKFGEAITQSGLSSPQLPEHLSDLMRRKEQYSVVEGDEASIVKYIRKSLNLT